jgi:type I restriction enzyme S subunit
MPASSVLFSSRAPIGYVAIAANDLCTNQGFKSIVPNEATDSLFLYYLLKYKKDAIENLGSGTTFKEVSGSTMRNVKVRVPCSLVEQRKIASVLGTVDDKIEENEKINNNLLQQAQAIFSKYYDASIDKQSFTSLIRVLGGGTPKTGNPEYWNGAVPFFTPKDLGEPYTFHTEKNLTEAGLNNCNSRLYPVNTSFVTARGTVGKVSLAGKPMAMNQSCYALASETIDPILVYFYVLKAVSSLKHKASGAVFDAIVTRDFDTEVINVLNSDDSKAVLEVIAPMMNAIHSNTEENIRLSSLRDALLPRLMSGELNVSEVEI